MDSLVERKSDLRGYIVGNGDKTKWRAWIDGLPVWVDDPADATRYGFRSDANAVHGEDEDAWCIVEYKDVATPSARITGDKDRGSPVEGAPYGEGLIGRITELERQLKVAREALGHADSWLGRWAQHVGNCKGEFLCTCGLTRIRFDVSQALANMEQADD